MTPDASRLPSEEEWERIVQHAVENAGRPLAPGAAIAAKVRALVRANLTKYTVDHLDFGPEPCAIVEWRMHGWGKPEPKCTCGLAALLADEEAPRG